MEVVLLRWQLCGICMDTKNGASQTIPESGTIGQKRTFWSKTMEEDSCQSRRILRHSDADIRAREGQPWWVEATFLVVAEGLADSFPIICFTLHNPVHKPFSRTKPGNLFSPSMPNSVPCMELWCLLCFRFRFNVRPWMFFRLM
jgi:hypothetical protein